jgi:hypothetical protein
MVVFLSDLVLQKIVQEQLGKIKNVGLPSSLRALLWSLELYSIQMISKLSCYTNIIYLFMKYVVVASSY